MSDTDCDNCGHYVHGLDVAMREAAELRAEVARLTRWLSQCVDWLLEHRDEQAAAIIEGSTPAVRATTSATPTAPVGHTPPVVGQCRDGCKVCAAEDQAASSSGGSPRIER